jgi:predicted PurR-regulated permease PerM
LERHGFKRPVAVLLLVVLSLAMLVGIGWAVSAQFHDLAGKLPDYQETIEAKLASLKLPHAAPWGR